MPTEGPEDANSANPLVIVKGPVAVLLLNAREKKKMPCPLLPGSDFPRF
ncbi:hypothetical protein QW131_12265 [Roseibium salinum]|nr:hypothetical protein [Roseibium salinum]